MSSSFPTMATPTAPSCSAYQNALDHLHSLAFSRKRADASTNGDRFDLMFDYLKMLDLQGPVSQLKVIHVAGTKGKGSTCSFAESILRSCGFRTGLFTSPHLLDLRERFKLDGMEISEEKFLTYFWWCWNVLQEKTDDDVPMPNLIRFLTLLAFKIFSSEQIDVAVLEVGIGGKFDSTNVVKSPVVCGISSLGYDHMEILGNSLKQIAWEKTGIFKEDVPAFTVHQPEEAMQVLEEAASQLGTPLNTVQPLSIGTLDGQKLGLDGEHQLINAGLAVALCSTWLKRTGNAEGFLLDDTSVLPEQFIRGLTTTCLHGRAQRVSDPFIQRNSANGKGGLIFYLDGAHSPESMDVCARWFSDAIKTDDGPYKSSAKLVLLFNCMPVRDPWLLLPRLINTCAENGIYFWKAIFAPNHSVFNKVVSHALLGDPLEPDLSWQRTVQKVWEELNRKRGSNGGEKDDDHDHVNHQENSLVFPSLLQALKWLRNTSQQDSSDRYQVLVTGSLHLVGDLLRALRNQP